VGGWVAAWWFGRPLPHELDVQDSEHVSVTTGNPLQQRLFATFAGRIAGANRRYFV
jgi:hypothetical protein